MSLVRQNASTTAEHIQGYTDYLEYEFKNLMDMLNGRPGVSDAALLKKLTIVLEQPDRIKYMDDDLLNRLKGLFVIVSRNASNSLDCNQ